MRKHVLTTRPTTTGLKLPTSSPAETQPKTTDDARTHTALPSSAEMQCAFPSRPLRAQKRGLYTDLRYLLFTEPPRTKTGTTLYPQTELTGHCPVGPNPNKRGRNYGSLIRPRTLQAEQSLLLHVGGFVFRYPPQHLARMESLP